MKMKIGVCGIALKNAHGCKKVFVHIASKVARQNKMRCARYPHVLLTKGFNYALNALNFHVRTQNWVR